MNVTFITLIIIIFVKVFSSRESHYRVWLVHKTNYDSYICHTVATNWHSRWWHWWLMMKMESKSNEARMSGINVWVRLLLFISTSHSFFLSPSLSLCLSYHIFFARTSIDLPAIHSVIFLTHPLILALYFSFFIFFFIQLIAARAFYEQK